jgi:CheY-like chemotaxis protein
MDIKVPDISGLGVTLLLTQDDQTENIQIIAVTALATPEDKRMLWRTDATPISLSL